MANVITDEQMRVNLASNVHRLLAVPDKNKIQGRILGQRKTPEQLRRLAEIRDASKQEFPPLVPSRLAPSTTGVAAQLREARERRGLT